MRIKEGFVLRQVCGEYVIVGEGLNAINFGRLLSLNETAAWIWKEAMKLGDFTAEQLTERLCEEYEVDANVARKDVETIIGQWQKENVVE